MAPTLSLGAGPVDVGLSQARHTFYGCDTFARGCSTLFAKDLWAVRTELRGDRFHVGGAVHFFRDMDQSDFDPLLPMLQANEEIYEVYFGFRFQLLRVR